MPPTPKKSRPAGARPPSRPIQRTTAGQLRITWSGMRTMYDFWGEPIKRHYTLDTLEHATNRMLIGQDKIIGPSIRQVVGNSAVISLAFELFQEGKFQLIFRVRALAANRKTAIFGFVVAKNHQELSTVAEHEHTCLRVMHERAPNHVVRPFHGGRIFFPPTRSGHGEGRLVFAYLTQWLGNYHELGVERDLNFYVNVLRPQRLTNAQTEDLKTKMVEIIARTYDPLKRDCMEMPQIASGDFVVTKPTQGPLKLKLIACRRIVNRISPAKLIHLIASTSWDWDGKPFKIVPTEAEGLFDGIVRARGLEEARSWIKAYRNAVLDGNLPEQDVPNKRALEKLCKK